MRDVFWYAFNVWQAIKLMPAECYFPICRVMRSRAAGDLVRRLLKPLAEALETLSGERRAQERPSASSRIAFRVFALMLVALFAYEASGSEVRDGVGCPGSLPDLYKKVSPAVVSITAAPVSPFRVGEPIGRIVGSGFLFDAAGLVLTNAHLVFGQATISATLNDGRVVPAQLVGADPVLDVAVVRLSRSTGERFPVLKLGDSDHALVVRRYSQSAIRSAFNRPLRRELSRP
jgi:S1-C subfamily serine protease